LSQHRYVYVQSNPVNQIDPLGLKLVQVGGLELWRYCNDHHPGWKAHLKQGVATWLGDFGRDWAWRCQKYSWYPVTWGAGINYNLACEEQHGPGAYAALVSFDPYGIKCFKHVPDPPANQPKTQAGGGIVSAVRSAVQWMAAKKAAERDISIVKNTGTALPECGNKPSGYVIDPKDSDHYISQGFSSEHGAIDIAPIPRQTGVPLRSVLNGYVVEKVAPYYPERDFCEVETPSGKREVSQGGAGYCMAGHAIKIGTEKTEQDSEFVAGYAHLEGESHLAMGAPVKKGEIVGRLGSTGCSTGPHVHFTIERGKDNFVDPLLYVTVMGR
jgi:murein DD-endopeptidase MepM/ murein hydrolase activator NlpD